MAFILLSIRNDPSEFQRTDVADAQPFSKASISWAGLVLAVEEALAMAGVDQPHVSNRGAGLAVPGF